MKASITNSQNKLHDMIYCLNSRQSKNEIRIFIDCALYLVAAFEFKAVTVHVHVTHYSRLLLTQMGDTRCLG